jgi:hypothetical protein
MCFSRLRVGVVALLLAVFSFLGGCSSQQEVAGDSPSANEKGTVTAQEAATPAKQRTEAFVFRAKYYQTKGPCIQIGDTFAMPAVDAFEVVERVKGDLKAKCITVRALTGGGPAYPKKLAEGKVYTLRLSPSERTKQQLRGNEKEGYSYVVVDGDEIEELGK